jgi:hypothetical protein
MKRLIIVFLLALLGGSILFAQIYTDYTFSASTGTYTPITGTEITVIHTDDEISGAIPIGFTFVYSQEAYTEVKITSNGWMGLGTAAISNNNINSLSSETAFPVIAPLWDDISLASGTCQYITTGTAPTRVFTVQYQNANWDYSATNSFNFQIKLFENGKIEFIYGPSTGTPGFPSASIGINVVPGGAQNFYSITPGTPATASFTAENTNISTFPGNGVIYTFDTVVPVPNDLAAYTITGNITPTQGTASNYTVSIRNMGTAAQSNYSVKIMSGANILASVAGTNIAPGITQNVIVPWTPQTTGVMTIYGKVVLPGDAYPQNDMTSTMNVIVQETGTIVVTIGDGNELGNIPVNMYWKNSLFETIYQANEINMGGIINGVSFYNNFVTNLPQEPTKIWLGMTQLNDLSAGWIPSTSLVQVFDGNVDYPEGSNVITIPFSIPFAFGGGNLVMMVNRPMDTVYYSSADQFSCQTVGTNRTRHIYNDFTLYDPANPPLEATLTGQFPKTSLYFANPSIPATFGIAPESKNFGTLLLNATASQLFTMFNLGSGTLTISSVSISGSPFFTLQNLPALPVALTTGQNAAFLVQYHPTSAGNHSATITITDSMTRLQHTVQLTGVCMDPTIYTSPYLQSFDNITPPNLPLDWQKLFVPAVMWGDIQTVASAPHSPPNCVSMNNSGSQTSDILLIAPPLATGLVLPAMRVKFWAKGYTTSTLQVGILSDITDAATFSSVSTVTLNTGWTEYIVAFQTYEGTGRHITFKHGNSNMYEGIYIDDVTIENTPQNDLAALSITGSNTPSVNAASNYVVNIFNWGTNPQSNYSVKLFKSGNVEIASVPGTLINPGQQVAITLAWTPTVAGNTFIYGKVVLAGDQNTLNDQTANLNLLVQAAGTTTVTIGAGDQLANIPVNMFYRNSLFETVFNAADIIGGGSISAIAFYNNFVTNLPQKPTKIWLGATDQSDLSGGWIPSTQLTLVYDGLVDYPAGINTIIIPFTTPYPYGGTNLVMMVNRPMDTTYFNWSDMFYAQTVGSNSSLSAWSDMDNYDPANPPTDWVNTSGQFPKTSFFFMPSGPNPQFGVAPANKNFGTVLLNATKLQTFTVFNSGGSPLIINSIALSGSPMYSLQNLPTLPITLNAGQNTTFVAQYHPTAAGAHAATITITDNQTRTRTPHAVALTAVCIDPTIYTSPYGQNFDTVAIPALPIDWQKIYQAATISGFVQTSSNDAYSNPNSVMLYNADNEAADILLIAPPLASALNITTMRVKFWAQSGGYQLEVGVIADITNPATFTSISTLNISQDWAEYVVSFQTYTGTGQNIAFRHGLGGIYRDIYIDDVTIEATPQNDLAAISISGNTTPSVGMTTNYTVNLFNWGTNAQSNYTVKLYKEGDVEIASVAGTTINPGLAAQIVISWTPAAQGATYIYAKVILTADQNNLNNQTPNLNVSIQPAGTMVVTIGDGSQNARMPVDMYYCNSLFETIYLSSELNFIGMINGITFYNNFSTSLSDMPTNVWLGTTTQTGLSDGWIPSTNLTQVFAGTVNYPSGENTITITFPQPFLYLEGNLVMMVERPMDEGYYSPSDQFYCQTVGSNRTRNIYDDQTDFDPANPPDEAGIVSGQFPKTSFFIIPGGVGHLIGNVYGAANVPLNNTTVQIVGGGQATTNAQGHYQIQNIIAGTYQVTASRFGYISQTVTVIIPEDSTVTRNFTLTQMPTVNVTGTVVGSDALTVGLSGAIISLTGMENYTATTNAQGQFSISGVYSNQVYEYGITRFGYQYRSGSISVAATNYSMGTLIIDEIAYSPMDVSAEQNESHNAVNLSWQPPDPNAVDITQGFESTTFPPAEWIRIITNSGAAGPNGVYPTWCRIGAVTDGTVNVVPHEGDWQCGFWWAYSHQDEWLITPQFNCPQGAALSFETYAYFGSPNDDHYYVKITTNNGESWDILWDATALTGGVYNYVAPIEIDLTPYAGQQVKIAWHADDPNSTNDGMWYNWFIDDIVIGNSTTTIRFSETALTSRTVDSRNTKPAPVQSNQPMSRAEDRHSFSTQSDRSIASEGFISYRSNRSLVGYKVWRLVQGQEQNEANWALLTPATITVTDFSDIGWAALQNGTYKWAIKGVYTNNVLSLAAFSNAVVKQPSAMGTLAGVVRNLQNMPVMGATITAGPFTATTSANGNYLIQIAVGTYAVTCTATGYQTMTTENVVITEGQTTACNFNMPVGNADVVNVDVTALRGNYPNPFNPETTINYDVKGIAPVKIEIYNTKGQLIRTLVNQTKAGGRYQIVWNGRDNNGNSVASGIYHYRMQAGDYQATRRMMLMK